MTLKRDIGRSPVVPSLRPRGRLSDRNDTRTRKERRLCTRTTVDVDPTSFPHTEERHPKDRNGIRTTEDDYERHRTVLKDEIRTTIEGRLPLEQREEDMTFRTTDRHPTDKIVRERPVNDGMLAEQTNCVRTTCDRRTDIRTMKTRHDRWNATRTEKRCQKEMNSCENEEPYWNDNTII